MTIRRISSISNTVAAAMACLLCLSDTTTAQDMTPSFSPSFKTISTPIPTASPTSSPTLFPTVAPSIKASNTPSYTPSVTPSGVPTHFPSTSPSHSPTKRPTSQPTKSPSETPSLLPTSNPSTHPTSTPSSSPTGKPTVVLSSTPSSTPSFLPTGQPTFAPSSTPSITPSIVPSRKPTDTPSSSPSSTPSLSPTRQPTVTSSSNPSSKPSSLPTILPTSTPTLKPSVSPSFIPTKFASSEPSSVLSSSPTISFQPSSYPTERPTLFPSGKPTSSPTEQPTTSPTLHPSQKPSSEPTFAPSSFPSNMELSGEESNIRLTLVNFDAGKLENRLKSDWESVTSSYIQKYYDENDAEDGSVIRIIEIETSYVDGFSTSRILSNHEGPEFYLRQQSRVLQSLRDFVITYSQTVKYRYLTVGTQSQPLQISEILEFPFATSRRQSDYLSELKIANEDAFDSVTGVSPVTVIPEPPIAAPVAEPLSTPTSEGDGSDSDTIIIASVTSAAAVVVLAALAIVYYNKRRSGRGSMNSYDREEADDMLIQPTVIVDDGSSALVEPTPRLGMMSSNESIGLYGDESIATQDYDYAKAYGSQSVTSSAGGTFGSAAFSGAKSTSNDTPSFFSKDPNFDALYRDEQEGNSEVNEELIDVYCPPGKLGVVIDTPDNGAPVVHSVKDSSVVADQIKVGDKVFAVDDEDVRQHTAIKVSKMISRKSANPTRKLTLLRRSEQ